MDRDAGSGKLQAGFSLDLALGLGVDDLAGDSSSGGNDCLPVNDDRFGQRGGEGVAGLGGLRT